MPRNALIAAGIVGLLAIPIFLELVMGFSPAAKEYIAYGVLCALFILLCQLPRRTTLFVLGAFFLGLTVLHLTPWTARKVFLQHFAALKVGMTGEEVAYVMWDYAYWVHPQPSGQMIHSYFHSWVGRFDSDRGVVTFANSRVVGLEFCPE